MLVTAFGAAGGGGGEGEFGSRHAAAIVVAHVLFTAIVFAYARARHGASPRDLGMRPPRGGDVLFALALYAASIPGWVAASMLAAALEGETPVQRSVAFFREAGVLDRLLLATTAVVTAPVAEELLFRGVLFTVLRSSLGVWPAAILSALIFGALHADAAWLPLVWLGFVLALVHQKTGTLFAPIAVHAAHNAAMLGVLVLAPESGGRPV